MAKRVRHRRRWSAHSIWLAACSRRFWLASPQQNLRPPDDLARILGVTVHQIIFDSINTGPTPKREQVLADFSKLWHTQTMDFAPDKADSMLTRGNRCLEHFFHDYFELNARPSTLVVNTKVGVCLDRHGKAVISLDSPEKPDYELFGIVDEIRYEDGKVIIRDYKVSFHQDKQSMFRYRLQFGIYRTCLKATVEQEIDCEIYDLQSGMIIPIESFSSGQIHALVRKAEKRILGHSKTRNLKLCPTCQYQPVCQNPYAPWKEWRRNLICPEQLSLSPNP